MDGGVDWSGHLRTLNYPNASAALQGVQSWGGTTFFFYCDAPVDLGPGIQFAAGDTVFFAGTPTWRTAPQCTGFSLSAGCSDIYNPPQVGGACPANPATAVQDLERHQDTSPGRIHLALRLDRGLHPVRLLRRQRAEPRHHGSGLPQRDHERAQPASHACYAT